MNTLSKTLTLLTALALIFGGPVRAQDTANDSSVSFQTFYDQLSSEGQWVNSDQYGYVFQPTENDPTWRPYTYGHWVNTEAGLTWASDESFGWATDHYGRWTNLDGYGWVWVPGYTWAPAWVSWRDGGDDVGWAPLPPDSDIGIDYNSGDYGSDFGFHIGNDCDLAYGIGPWWYNFCPVVFIGDRNCWRHFRDRRDNFGFIHRTRNVTNINFRRDGVGRFGRVRTAGPSVAALNARAHTPIQTARLASVSNARAAGLRGNTLDVFAPRVDRSTVRTTRPASVSGTIASARVNRGTDVNHALAVNSRVSAPAATLTQIHAASMAQTGFANARVATTGTHFSRTSTQPLTSMRTETRPATTISGNSRSFTPARNVNAPAYSRESTFTGQSPATRSAIAPSRTYSAYDNAAMQPARTFNTPRTTRVYPSGQDSYGANRVYGTQPVSRMNMPSSHYSVPASRPESSFRTYGPATQSRLGGGGSAPAVRSSGGGPSGEGRSASASVGGGGGRSDGGGNSSGGNAGNGGGHGGRR